MVDEKEKSFIEHKPFTDKDDNGRTYTKTVYYMKESVRVSIKTQMRLLTYSKSAQLIYWNIINQLNKDEYEVTVTRSVLKNATGLSDASVSRAIEELTKVPESKEENDEDRERDEELYMPLVKIVDKDTYHIPINQCVKGNVNTIIRKEEELKQKLQLLEREKEEREKITKLSLKLRNKK